MATLLLRLEGPMQSWGTQSRFLVRDTGLEPSKSGVVGLLCAAMGKPRAEAPGEDDRWPALRRLTSLRMGVRVDRPGIVRKDYHTAGGTRKQGTYGVAKADGSAPGTVVSQRYYLADAAFLVGLESEDHMLLARLHRALASPVWPLSLGRKSFVPGAPVYLHDGLRQESLLEAFNSYPLLSEPSDEPVRLRLVLDASPSQSSEVRPDAPVSFSARQFTIRHVLVREMEWVPQGSEVNASVSIEAGPESA